MSLGERLLLQVESPRELQEEENSDNSMKNGVLKELQSYPARGSDTYYLSAS